MENNNLVAIYRAQADEWLERAIRCEAWGISTLVEECLEKALAHEKWAIGREARR